MGAGTVSELFELGEERHETCRFGTLNKAVRISIGDGRETPTLQPICHWSSGQPTPPALRRAWGGAVEYERDCAVCPVHQVVAP